MLACLHAAVAEVERVLGLDELRAGCGSLNLVEEDTGDIIDVIPASIASSRTTASAFAARHTKWPSWVTSPLLRHVRTRACSAADQRRHQTLLRHPQVRAPIDDGGALAVETARFRYIYN